MLGLAEHHHAARAEHDVEVQLLAKIFVKPPRQFIDRRRRLAQIIRADDRRVPARVSTAEPALFDHRHVADPVVLGEVIGGGEAVSARADDDDVVFGLRLWRAPGALPPCMVAGGLFRDGEGGIAFHGIRSLVRSGGFYIGGPGPKDTRRVVAASGNDMGGLARQSSPRFFPAGSPVQAAVSHQSLAWPPGSGLK